MDSPFSVEACRSRERIIASDLLFLIAKYLDSGVCKRASKVLFEEIREQNLVPVRFDWQGNRHTRTLDEWVRVHPHVGGETLLRLCGNLLPLLDRQCPAGAAGVNTLLGAGSYSVLRTQTGENLRCLRLSKLCARVGGRAMFSPPALQHAPNKLLVLLGRQLQGRSLRSQLVTRRLFSHVQLLKRTLGHLSAVYCCLFDKSGFYILTGADDRLVKVWSSINGRLMATLRGATAEISDLAVSHDNRLVAAGSCDKIVRVWDLLTSAPVAVLSGHGGHITAVDFCAGSLPQQQFLVSTANDGCVAFWYYEWRSATEQGDSGASGGERPYFCERPVKINERVRPGQAQLVCLSFSAGGTFLAIGGADHHVRVYVTTGADGPERVLEVEAHSERVDSVQWCHAGCRFVSGSKDGSVIVWRFERQEWLRLTIAMNRLANFRGPQNDTRQQQRPLRVNLVRWTSDDTRVIVTVSDTSFRVYDSVSGELLHALAGHTDEVFVIEAHPRHADVVLTAGHDGKLIVWDIDQGIQLASHFNAIESEGHGCLFDARWSPCGMFIAATDSHGQLSYLGLAPDIRFDEAPCEQFFHTDYRPLLVDASHHVLDEETQLAPHLMPAPFLVDMDGAAYPARVQRLVPGRERASARQLQPHFPALSDPPPPPQQQQQQQARPPNGVVSGGRAVSGGVGGSVGSRRRSTIDDMIDRLANERVGSSAPGDVSVMAGPSVSGSASSSRPHDDDDDDNDDEPVLTRGSVVPRLSARQLLQLQTFREHEADREVEYYEAQLRLTPWRRHNAQSAAVSDQQLRRLRRQRRLRQLSEQHRRQRPDDNSELVADRRSRRSTRHQLMRLRRLGLRHENGEVGDLSMNEEGEGTSRSAANNHHEDDEGSESSSSTSTSSSSTSASSTSSSSDHSEMEVGGDVVTERHVQARRSRARLEPVAASTAASVSASAVSDRVHVRSFRSRRMGRHNNNNNNNTTVSTSTTTTAATTLSRSSNNVQRHTRLTSRQQALMNRRSRASSSPTPGPSRLSCHDNQDEDDDVTADGSRRLRANRRTVIDESSGHDRSGHSDSEEDSEVTPPPPARAHSSLSPSKPPNNRNNSPRKQTHKSVSARTLVSHSGESVSVPVSSQWLSEVQPRRSPYFPQIDDQLVYFRQGHQLYVDAVRRLNVYEVHNNSLPWSRCSVKEVEFVRVVGVHFEVLPPCLCTLKLRKQSDCATGGEGCVFSLKYHDMQGVVDFLVLRSVYDAAVRHKWKTGDEFRAWIDDMWWTGVVSSVRPLHSSTPRSPFMCYQVTWSQGETEALSPWDMEPPDQCSSSGRPVWPVSCGDWAGADPAAERRRISSGLRQVMQLAVAESFLTPVDLNNYPSYTSVVAYPVDLSSIKDRVDNGFYRCVAALLFDIGHLSHNAQLFNEPLSAIVGASQVVRDVCLALVEDSSCRDINAIYRQVCVQHGVGRQTELVSVRSPSTATNTAGSSQQQQQQRSPRLTRQVTKRRFSDKTWQEHCEELLKCLVEHADSEHFRQPVNARHHPDYYQMVEQPMDLATIGRDLSSGSYTTPQQFTDDVRIIFSNSKLYNTNKRSQIYTMTLRLSGFFEVRMKPILSFFSARQRPCRLSRAANHDSGVCERVSNESNDCVRSVRRRTRHSHVEAGFSLEHTHSEQYDDDEAGVSTRPHHHHRHHHNHRRHGLRQRDITSPRSPDNDNSGSSVSSTSSSSSSPQQHDQESSNLSSDVQAGGDGVSRVAAANSGVVSRLRSRRHLHGHAATTRTSHNNFTQPEDDDEEDENDVGCTRTSTRGTVTRAAAGTGGSSCRRRSRAVSQSDDDDEEWQEEGVTPSGGGGSSRSQRRRGEAASTCLQPLVTSSSTSSRPRRQAAQRRVKLQVSDEDDEEDEDVEEEIRPTTSQNGIRHSTRQSRSHQQVNQHHQESVEEEDEDSSPIIRRAVKRRRIHIAPDS